MDVVYGLGFHTFNLVSDESIPCTCMDLSRQPCMVTTPIGVIDGKFKQRRLLFTILVFEAVKIGVSTLLT